MTRDALRRVRAAARARAAAQERFEEALRAARADGVSLREIATVAGVTHARVAQIVGPMTKKRKETKR